MKLTKSSRHSQILTQITQTPSLRVAELAARMGVSTETIRRDLDELTGQGLVNRTYGGAVRTPSTEPSVGERHALFVAERERIARAASALIRPGSLLMMGAGATTTHVARRIGVEHKGLTVITHSFGVATVLALNPTITVLMAPGAYLPSEGATVGAHTTRFLNQFSADLAILGASGLTEEGATDALVEPAAVYGVIASRAAATMVVADQSKFDRVFAARYASWREIGVLVTDAAPTGGLAEALGRHRITVVEA
ncbi:DeoR/GlpR family DNA-binding transcription regulator [Hansschlegelia plantiphila]|uniref:DeoR family transcriptional regulator n=1 Tax=Hansschlegelia plantiphila TaxID=374655 RepID=A0A9W6IXH4_9HYPH|nr:DeoR/GlpR family DNA-binding transcription regulator [Hansschlegelia plantiphila]GLK66946.1 DeoR family transcriptional regulator [Hansschlegelia plantiphila]